MINELNALALLAQCRGDEIWSIDYAQKAGVPRAWIEELSDTFESGFDRETNRIYTDGGLTNHYEGIRDLDLGYRIAQHLGFNCDQIRLSVFDRRRQMDAIKQLIEED